jgi:Ferritin-like domain
MRVPELGAVEVQGMTRADFILRGALATGAVYGLGAVGPYVARSLAQSASGDIDVLVFALRLERLEAAFYDQAVKRAGLGGELRQLATTFGEQEAAHAETLQQTIEQLGGQPGPAPKARFQIGDEERFLSVAVALEEAGVGAYNGAGPVLGTPELLSAAGAIVQVEARHAAALRMHAGDSPAPAAFDEALTPPQVTAAVEQATGS